MKIGKRSGRDDGAIGPPQDAASAGARAPAQPRGAAWAGRRRLLDRLQVRLAARAPAATGFATPPEPRSIGSLERGRDLLAGRALIEGERVQLEGRSIWDIGTAEASAAEALHDFAWLEDLAALGGAQARGRAQDWLQGWIARYGGGRGPGWAPRIMARRLMRWIDHAPFVLRGCTEDERARLLRSLGAQTAFLARHWQRAEPGLPRIEALAGLIHAGLSLEGIGDPAEPATGALAQEVTRRIDETGAIHSRNPEALLEILSLLGGTVQALVSAERRVPPVLRLAMGRIAATLRALRHADGGLARFHGGGRGAEGRLDQALAASGSRARPGPGLHMGYARLGAGRTTLILDAAPPPSGAGGAEPHASTLAFELTSGRRPLIVNCGAGGDFGPDWRQAGRATASHSTLALQGYSSARFGQAGRGGAERLTDGPRTVPVEPEAIALRLETAHDGWRRTHGLTHARILDLSSDGRSLTGEDLLTTLSPGDTRRFDQMLGQGGNRGLGFSIHFHLHPDVDAAEAEGGSAVALALRNGEIWVLRHDGAASLALERSMYLEAGRPAPRPTQQVVLSARAMAYATRVRWTLSKAQDTPQGLRDVARPEDEE